MMRLLLSIVLVGVTLATAQEPDRTKNIAVMDLQSGPGVSDFMMNLINEYLGTSVYNSTEYHVIAGKSIHDLLKHLGKQKLLACGRKRCLASVGDALGVGKVIGGNIEKSAGGYLVHLMLVRSDGGKLLAYLKEEYTADESQLVSQLDAYIIQLFELEKKNMAQQARELEERRELMRMIVSESASTEKRISYAAGVAVIAAKNVDPVTAGDLVKIRYKHARHHFGFDYVSTEGEYPNDGQIQGTDPLKRVTTETGSLSGYGVSYGFEWLKLLSGWITVTPGLTVGSYSYDYVKRIEPYGTEGANWVNFVNETSFKSSAGGFTTVDVGNAFGPIAVEGYYTFKLLYLPDIMRMHEFGGRLSYIIGK